MQNLEFTLESKGSIGKGWSVQFTEMDHFNSLADASRGLIKIAIDTFGKSRTKGITRTEQAFIRNASGQVLMELKEAVPILKETTKTAGIYLHARPATINNIDSGLAKSIFGPFHELEQYPHIKIVDYSFDRKFKITPTSEGIQITSRIDMLSSLSWNFRVHTCQQSKEADKIAYDNLHTSTLKEALSGLNSTILLEEDVKISKDKMYQSSTTIVYNANGTTMAYFTDGLHLRQTRGMSELGYFLYVPAGIDQIEKETGVIFSGLQVFLPEKSLAKIATYNPDSQTYHLLDCYKQIIQELKNPVVADRGYTLQLEYKSKNPSIYLNGQITGVTLADADFQNAFLKLGELPPALYESQIEKASIIDNLNGKEVLSRFWHPTDTVLNAGIYTRLNPENIGLDTLHELKDKLQLTAGGNAGYFLMCNEKRPAEIPYRKMPDRTRQPDNPAVKKNHL
ncbi:hypothetical protein PV783_13750 [Chitinophaga sp. CC14]|uniref:hypothetical protein n=1 Tax=Chitinophaga sp. CC14 TaxID=3029199 RepID=UPI003B805825